MSNTCCEPLCSCINDPDNLSLKVNVCFIIMLAVVALFSELCEHHYHQVAARQIRAFRIVVGRNREIQGRLGKTSFRRQIPIGARIRERTDNGSNRFKSASSGGFDVHILLGKQTHCVGMKNGVVTCFFQTLSTSATTRNLRCLLVIEGANEVMKTSPVNLCMWFHWDASPEVVGDQADTLTITTLCLGPMGRGVAAVSLSCSGLIGLGRRVAAMSLCRAVC